MIENSISAPDDRVTLYVDVMKIEGMLKHEALVAIGHWLGTQGFQYEIDAVKSFYQNNWLAVRLFADDAIAFKLRFPIVPDSESESDPYLRFAIALSKGVNLAAAAPGATASPLPIGAVGGSAP